MEDDQDFRKMVLTMIVTLFLSFLFLVGICSCTSVRYVPVESVRTDSIYLTKIEKEDVYLHDSVYIKEKGDTIYMYKYRYLDRYKFLTDTCYIARTDTIVNVVEVERPLTRWEKAKQEVGGIAMGVLGVLVVLGIVRLIRRIKDIWNEGKPTRYV